MIPPNETGAFRASLPLDAMAPEAPGAPGFKRLNVPEFMYRFMDPGVRSDYRGKDAPHKTFVG